MATKTLAQVLDQMTTMGELVEKANDNRVRCVACGHRCVIFEGKRGICQVRFNRGGQLFVPHGYVAALQSDPVEKKPFFHVLPGADALTFGMLGCDFHCPYCQNWVTSQALRDDAAGAAPRPVTAAQLVEMAQKSSAHLVVSSYNEPLITAEWAKEVFTLAKEADLMTGFVSNGNATPEALSYLRPFTDCYKVDLKSMRQHNYRELGGQLKHVLWTIEEVYRRGFWVEVVTLIVPGFNDSPEELRDAATFVAGVSPDIPWHVTAFHKDYRMTDPDDTSAQTLIRAAEIGAEVGLRYVYAGNLPGRVQQWENTHCPQCRRVLIARTGYRIEAYHITPEGRCPSCAAVVPGRWWSDPTSRVNRGDHTGFVRVR